MQGEGQQVQQGARTVYDVDMGRTIGYVGGSQGAALGNPPTQLIRIIIEGSNKVITGFPA
jgi:hypothetical protein